VASGKPVLDNWATSARIPWIKAFAILAAGAAVRLIFGARRPRDSTQLSRRRGYEDLPTSRYTNTD